MSKRPALIVAAIDFGTTYSGYAFSFRHEFEQDPSRINASSWTVGSRANISLKTPSCILFRPDKQFDSFGFEAEDHYSDLTLDNEHRDWFYFSRFKMLIYESVHRTMKIRDETGNEMSAVDVFTAAIRYLHVHLMKSCNDKMGHDVDMRDCRWVLTVPSIWNDGAKQFMREAAELAGIPGECLILALEPEAASMFCKYVPLERMSGSADNTITCFQPRSKYLVLDAGGGTIDITVHEVLSGGKLRELCKANGGAWGGTTIDEAFIAFIEDIMGKTGPYVMKKFREENNYDYLELLREFEVKKRIIQPNMGPKVTFQLPISLLETYRSINNKEIREAARNQTSLEGKITFIGGKMRVDADVMKSLFSKTNSNIVDHIDTLLKDPVAQCTTSILMVGGFSESPMLQDAVKRAFPNMSVVIPHDAGLAVLKGAVIFGHNSNVITSRIAKYTYGLKCYKPFDPSIHFDRKRMILTEDGKQTVRGCFDKLIEVGQSVSLDEPSAGKSYVPTEDKSHFSIKLHASPKKDPVFVDEKDCVRIGEVNVDCRDKRGGIGSATVQLIFGGTELEVIAFHNTTGERTQAKFDFLE